MISPAEISKDSAGSIVMMSSNAKATTSVSFGVAACAGTTKGAARTNANAADCRERRRIDSGNGFIGNPIEKVGKLGWEKAGKGPRAVYTGPNCGINRRFAGRGRPCYVW